MENLIRLKSRNTDFTYLKKLCKSDNLESKTYVISNPILRGGETEDGKKFIDPSGGPMIIEGCKVEEADAVVKSIDFVEGCGWTITF